MSRTFFGITEIFLLTVRNFYCNIDYGERRIGEKMTLGEKIRTARKAKNLTQQQLANMVGAKHNSVSDWEKDKSKPDMDTIELLCGALELTPTYLVGSKSDDEYADMIGKLMNEPGLLDMIDDYKSLSLEDKKAIRQIISSLKNGRG